jgi:hypothetical protein
MKKQTPLCESDVKRWLAGQREAAKLIERERTESLLSRPSDQAWGMYLSLLDSRLTNPPDATEPSHLLTAMRRALDQHAPLKQTSL